MKNYILNRLSVEQLRGAAALREKIEAMEKEFAALIGIQENKKSGSVGKKRRLSAAARRRIGQATKARWAKFRAQKKG